MCHTGHDIEIEAGLSGGNGDGVDGAVVASLSPPHPVVVILQSVKTYCQGAHFSIHQSTMHLFVIKPPVAHYAPADTASSQGLANLRQVGSQQGLATGDDHGEWTMPLLGGNGVESFEEVFERHVFLTATVLAVASAVEAMEVAACGAFPEQIVEFVDMSLVGSKQPKKSFSEKIHISVKSPSS